MLVLQANFANLASFADALSGMEHIQYFNTFVCNPINNQVCIEDDVAIFAAFGCKVATFGIPCIIFGKRVYGFIDFLQVTFSLKVSKCVKRVFVNTFATFSKFPLHTACE